MVYITIAGLGGLINDELVIIREALQANGWEVETNNEFYGHDLSDEEPTLEDIKSRRQKSLDMGYTEHPRVLIKMEHWNWPG